MCVLGLSSLVSWKNLESMDCLLQVYILCVHAKLLQSSQILFDPKDCSSPGSSVHGILQARILEWVAMPSSREIFLTQGSKLCLLRLLHCRWILYPEPLGKPISSVQFSCSVVSDSLQLHGMQHARLPCPWDFPGKNTEVGCYFLLQGIFLTQGSNTHLLRLLYWLADSLPLLYLGNSNLF